MKSDYFIQKFFGYMSERKYLETIRYNKSIQKRINLNINHYKEYSEKFSSIEIEIKPMKYKYGKFIDIYEYKKYYHIFFNDNKSKEIKRTSINEDDEVSKINIIIDHQVESFYELFDSCYCIESICFKKFYRNNITNIGWMFYNCESLKELNLNNFNTDNVTDMNHMFCGCSSLKELNLNKFNTDNVTDMNHLFCGCSSLKELNLNNFKTNNVTNMEGMFFGCFSLTKLNINNLNTNNVTNMSYMFFECYSLKELNLNNFNINKIYVRCMFTGCSDELKLKIKNKFKNLNENAFL